MKRMPVKQEPFKYAGGERKMISIRLPKQLLVAIKEIAEEKKSTTTEVIQFALDQYAVLELGAPKKK